MRNKTILTVAIVAIAIIAIGFLWHVSIFRPPELPPVHIPGMQSIEMISYDNRGGDFDVTIKYLGMEYECNLYIAISAEGKWILPREDEVFTVVVSDEKNLVLTANNKTIGRLPIVFISLIDNSKTYRMGAPNQSKKPIFVSEGSVNLAHVDSNTLIRGAEGLRVKVFEEGVEIASGRLPLAVNIQNLCVLAIEGLQTRALSGKGLIQGYWGIRDIYEGTYSVYPSGRFTGVDLIKLEGYILASTDNHMVLVSKTFDSITLWDGESTHRIELDDITVRPGRFAHITPDGSLVFTSVDDRLFIADKEGIIKELFWSAEPSDIKISGDILISGDGSLFNPITGEEGNLNIYFDFIHGGCGMRIEDNELTGWKLSTENIERVWSVDAVDMEGAEMTTVSSDIIYFTDGNLCTQFLNVTNGFTSEVPDIFAEPAPLEWINDRVLNFPGGEGIDEGILAFDADDEMVWSRPGGHLSQVGHQAVMVTSGDEIHVYDLGTGIETCSWKHDPTSSVHPTDGVEVISVDEDTTVLQIIARTVNGGFDPWVVIVTRNIFNSPH